MKTCTMCGKEKLLEEFRTYKNGKRWPYCNECQAIEGRRRYLESKGAACSVDEQDELVMIGKLYQLRADKGLKTFGTRRSSTSVMSMVSKQIEDLS